MKRITLLLSILFLWTCGGGGGSSPTEPEPPPIVINLTSLGGQAQKGPFNNGTAINVAELTNALIPTGRNFSTAINDNTGRFSVPNVQLESPYVELRANGFYFNEVTNEISDAQLTLYALSNLTGKSSLNVNIITHLEKNRMQVLMSGEALQTFAQAKLQAQEEVFAVFDYSRANVPESELLDISQGGAANAKLLAMSAIIQGDLNVGQMSELLANISTDIASDGTLDDTSLREILIDNSKNLDMAEVRSNLAAHYSSLGISATIPDFESEIDQFLKPPVSQDINASTTEDTAINITLAGSDPEGDSLTYTILEVNNATVTLNGNVANYTPNTHFNGTDTFTYYANDGTSDSNIATVTMTVTAEDDNPNTIDVATTTNEDIAVSINLTADEYDGDNYSFSIVSDPSNGAVGLSGSTATYTPNQDFNGEDTFTFEATDDRTLLTNVATATITVNPVNDAPVANNITNQVTNENRMMQLDITLDATDVDGDALTYSISSANNGTLSLNNDIVTYVPTQDWNGTDTFTYTANDGSLDSNTASVTITINAVNDAPVASDVSASTNEDTTKEITLDATDVDGDALTYSIISTNNGTVTISDVTATYTPDSNYNGTDTFTYTANDGSLDSNTATITITVNAVNDQPVANDISTSTDEDISVVFQLTANEYDGDSYSFAITSDVSNGTTSLNGSVVTYTPNQDFNGEDTFTFEAIDDTGRTINVATATITVNAVNDAPTAVPVSKTMDEDGGTIDVETNYSDVDGDTDLTFTLVDAPSNGTATVGIPGTYTPNANFNGTDTFTYTVTDAEFTSDPATVTITITAVNDAPTLTGGTVSTNEDNIAIIDLDSLVIDVDGDILTYLGPITSPSNGSVTLSGPTVTYTPTANWNGTDTFTFKVNDGTTDSNTATFNVIVAAVNDVPVSTDASATTDEDTNILIDLSNNMTDVDNEQAMGEVTIVVTAVPSNGSLFQWDGSTDTPGDAISIGSQAGQQVNNFAGIVKLWYVPQSDYNGADSFNFKAQDENDGEYSSGNISTATITVNAVNDKPTVSTITTSTPRNVTKNITLLGDDVDNDELTYTILTFKNSESNATLQSTTDSVAVYVPENSFFGSDYFTYKANDGIVDSDIDTVFIDVQFANLAPVAYDVTATVNENLYSRKKINSNNPKGDILEEQFSNQSNSVEITLNAEDVDNDTLIYSIVTDTSNGTTSISSDKVTYTPSTDWNGVDTFTYKVNDGFLDSNIAKVVVSVTPQNDAPIASNISASTNEDVAFQVLLQASDIDNDDLTYSIVTTNSASVSVDGNIATYTPIQDFNGIDTFEFKANDGVANSNTATATVTVAAVNDAPVASDVTFSVTESRNAKTIFNLVGSDVDGDDMSYLITDSVTKGTLSQLSESQINYTPNINFVGKDSLKYKVNDGKLDSNIATAIFDIQASNDAPTTNNIYHAMDEDKTTSITLSATDVDSQSFNYYISSGSSNATITQNDSVITYLPNQDYFGQDTFQYYVTDDDSTRSNVSTVYINVNPVEDAPKLDGGSESIYYTLEFGIPDTVSFKMPELDPDGDDLTLYFYDGSNTGFFQFSTNQDSLHCISCQGNKSVLIYGIDSKGNQGPNATYTVQLEGGPLGLVAVEEWEAGALSSGYPSGNTSLLRDERVSYVPLPSLGRTGYIVENRAGVVNATGTTNRDFDRFDYWTGPSQFHIELDFSTPSIAWEYYAGNVNGYVPFSAYLIDAFDGSREQLYAGFIDDDGIAGWSIDDDGDPQWSGPVYSADSYEPIYLFLGKDGKPYDPSKESEYISTNDLEASGGIGWASTEPRLLRSSIDFGTPPNVQYPLVTALLMTMYLGGGQLPTADGHAAYGSEYTGASSILFKTDFQIYNNPDGSSKEKNVNQLKIADDELPIIRYKPNQKNINDSVDTGLIQ